MKQHLSIREYQRRDYRLKCSVCYRWMQHVPKAKGVTQVRRPSPHAGTCTECPVKGDKTDLLVPLARSAISRKGEAV